MHARVVDLAQAHCRFVLLFFLLFLKLFSFHSPFAPTCGDLRGLWGTNVRTFALIPPPLPALLPAIARALALFSHTRYECLRWSTHSDTSALRTHDVDAGAAIPNRSFTDTHARAQARGTPGTLRTAPRRESTRRKNNRRTRHDKREGKRKRLSSVNTTRFMSVCVCVRGADVVLTRGRHAPVSLNTRCVRDKSKTQS